MSLPDWKEVLPTPPTGGSLREAWMTSFEPPDVELLVEHLLPSLLSSSHSLSQDPHERKLFFGELGTALETLHGQLTVISSPPRGGEAASTYPWLWTYVDRFIVGAKSRAVQHAKLWAFHWKVAEQELLELHVSSANLTTAAFKGQVQATWKTTLLLSADPDSAAGRLWGSLVPFLEALGESAGETATIRVQRLIRLLDRAICPHGVTFIVSIPGGKSAAKQLQQFDLSEVHVLAPTIGEWDAGTVSTWSKDAGLSPSKIRLKWISTKHPWAKGACWALSSAASAALKASGVKLECLPDETRFTTQHREVDPRWSHAKLYVLRSRRKRRLLVTSANWSPSAWGAGNLRPRNFELGVAFETGWITLETMGKPFEPPNTVPFCVERPSKERTSPLEWAEATWDGVDIQLRARSIDPLTPIIAFVHFIGGLEERTSLISGNATVPWNDGERRPTVARFIQHNEQLEMDVVDLRPHAEFAKTPLPEIDPAEAEALREAFLLQRYGGSAIDSDPLFCTDGGEKAPAAPAPAADYSVQAWLDGRAAFDVVDRWQAALTEAQSKDPIRIEQVRMDGEALRRIYARREGAFAPLVAEELGWRLDDNK